MSTEMVPTVDVERSIRLIRGRKVLLDEDLAALYEVPVKHLNERVRRNIDGFPAAFLFRLEDSEAANLRSQIATSRHAGRRYLSRAWASRCARRMRS